MPTENFTGSDGSAWPSPWTTDGGAGGSTDIQTNRGRMISPTTFPEGTRATYGTDNWTDFEMVVRLQFSNPITEQYNTVIFRFDSFGDAASIHPVNGYKLSASVLFNSFALYRYFGSDVLLDNVTYTFSAGTDVYIKLRAVGPLLRARIWNVGSGEPSTWTLAATDTGRLTGKLALTGQYNGANSTIYWDEFSIDDGVADQPGGPTLAQIIGSAGFTAAATTSTLAFTGNWKPQVGDWVFVYFVRDNLASNAASDTCTDTDGNTYTAITFSSVTTTAAAGVTGVLFYSKLTTAWSAGTNTITVNHNGNSTSVTARALLAEHWQGIKGIRANTNGTAASTAGGAIAVTTGATSPAIGDLVVGVSIAEWGNNAAATSVDADTTNGSWSTAAFIGNGTASIAGCKLTRQYKVVTAAGAQTVNHSGFGGTTSVETAGLITAFAAPTSLPPLRRRPMHLLVR